MEGSNYNRNMMRNGNTNYKDSMMEPCSLHGTLRKGMWGHNNPNDVTLEDDVFDEKPSPLPGLIAATVACKGGNNNQPGGGSRAIFINPPDPSHHPRYAYFSKGTFVILYECIFLAIFWISKSFFNVLFVYILYSLVI